MSKTNLENEDEIMPDAEQVFDNPLSHGILSKDEVARLLRKKLGTIIRMANSGALPCHYIGDTMMFYYHEILDAFLSDRLARRRRKDHANHPQKQSDYESRMVRSSGESSREGRVESLQNLARSFGLD